VSIGAATAGADALGRHAYTASAAWSVARARPDWIVAYAYDRWWPTLFASLSDDTDPWRSGNVRTREVNAGALLPFRRVRWTQNVLAAFSGSGDRFDCGSCTEAIGGTAKRRAIRLGWSFDDTRSYGYSISRESGVSIRATSETTRAALGADGNAGAMIFDATAYRRVFPRHGVIAARAAAATSWGDKPLRRVFSATGPGPRPAGFAFGSDAIGLLRGFASGGVAGEHAFVSNLDYRFPLSSIQRGVGTLPMFIRTAHAAVFVDAGHAWSDHLRWSDLRTSVGAEMSLDTVLGYAVPVTFTSGVALRNDPVTSRHGVVVFGRIGRAF
jgi:hypothetical protein